MGTSYSKAIGVSCLILSSVTAGKCVFKSTRPTFLRDRSGTFAVSPLINLRGGESATSDNPVATEEPSLDEKVHAAMKKLGITPPSDDVDECKDGVCPIPVQANSSAQAVSSSPAIQLPNEHQEEINPHELAKKIAKEMNVDERLAMAAIGATSSVGEQNHRLYNEQAARDMIQHELDLIESIPANSSDVENLVKEGFDPFLSRRALAFAENNMDDARAILIADQIDEEAEQDLIAAEDEEAAVRAQLRAEQSTKQLDMVEVKANFDPTKLPTSPARKAQPTSQGPEAMPKPAPKESVVFEATTAHIQELVLESPVPVLLDIYADWCGPCKVLGPALEDMAVKAGGMFRLVKVNSDNERAVSGALEVTALPTVYGIREGKIVHMFQGMPRSEEMMRNFMMGLFGAAPFSPHVTPEESRKYEELTAKLIKTAGAACFSFSAREKLTERITSKLDDLVKDDSVQDVEGSATLLRTLLNNIVKDPYEQKYRKINFGNKMIASKIGDNASCLAVLKSVGFAKSGTELVLAKGKKVINVAPLVVARDTIDKWIQKNRNEMAAAARKRKDELDRARLLAEKEAPGDEDGEAEFEEIEKVDPTACNLKLRIEGKKKVHDVVLHEDDPLSYILDALAISPGEDAQITCVAKRLVIKSSDDNSMKKSLKEHGLMPAAAIVVKVGPAKQADASSLKDRAAEKKSRKKGSHTMQSIGIYAKDDNNKAELIDGGGGVWYEHDVSDDEDETPEEKKESEVPKDVDASTGKDTKPGEG